MSDESDDINADFEFQNTQREIEELRKKEEELLTKMKTLANKRKSASDISAQNDSEEEERNNEEIGRRRRPSLSRGSSPTKGQERPRKRPTSIALSNESGTFRSRGSRSSSASPTKEKSVGSASTPRSTSSSPLKEKAVFRRGSNSNPTIRSSGNQARSPENKSYHISITSPRKPITQDAGSPSKITYKIKTSPSKANSLEHASIRNEGSAKNARAKMSRSSSTPEQSNKKLREKSNIPQRRSSGSKDDNEPMAKMSQNKFSDRKRDKHDRNSSEDAKAASMGNISTIDIPENQLIHRGSREDKSVNEDGKLVNTGKINDDSYEIIEIEDETLQRSSKEKIQASTSPRRGKDNLTARRKIELELAEQQKREEELKMLHSDGNENGTVDNSSNEEEDTDDDSEQEIGEEEISSDEEKNMEIENQLKLDKGRRIIEHEIEEQKIREEELKRIRTVQNDLMQTERHANIEPDEEKDSDEGICDDGDTELENLKSIVNDHSELSEHSRSPEQDIGNTEGESEDENEDVDDVFNTRNDQQVLSLSTKQKIELELAEQQLKEEEFRTHHKSKIVETKEQYNESITINSRELPIIVCDDGHEVRNESKSIGQLSTWEKIALEIEEEKKREEDVKQAHKQYNIEDYVKAEEVVMQEPEEAGNIAASYKIENLIDLADEMPEPIDSEKEDDVRVSEDSEEETKDRNSMQTRKAKEINEENQREREFRYAQNDIDDDESEDEETESIADISKEDKTRFNIQKEIDEFKQKELELKRLHGLEIDNSPSSEEEEEAQNSKGTLSLIEQEMAEQRQRELEYQSTVLTRREVNVVGTEHQEGERAVQPGQYSHEPSENFMKNEESEQQKKASFSPKKEPKEGGDRSIEEYGVKQGIARKFINLFNEGGEKLNKRNRGYEVKKEPDRRLNTESKKGGDKHSHAILLQSKEDNTHRKEHITGNEDGTEESMTAELQNNPVDNEEGQEHWKDQKGKTQESTHSGKKLVLKRKKSKKRDEEYGKSSENLNPQQTREQRPTIVDEKRRSFEKSKEDKKPIKKAHPLAMHWEKIQDQQKNEAKKNDIEMQRKKHKAERRKKRAIEEKETKEKEKHMLEIKELQDRRKSLAEAWENAKNNNKVLENTVKADKTTNEATKNSKKSPRKSPAKKKDVDSVSISKDEVPALARENIRLWEKMIASNTNK